MPAISPIFPGINIIDTDTHWSEPHDLWTSRAPTKYRDLVPQMREINGRRKWVVNGDIPLAGDSAASAILPDGEKMLGLEFLKHDVDMVHAAFAHRRKVLPHSLALKGLDRERAQEALVEIGHPADARAERLSPDDFRRLAAILRA